MRNFILTATLLIGSLAHAGIFDNTAEVTVKSLYKKTERGDLAGIQNLTTTEGYKIFSSPEVMASIKKDITDSSGALKFDSRLTSTWKENSVTFNKFLVVVSSKTPNAIPARVVETICKIKKKRICEHDDVMPGPNCYFDFDETCLIDR